MNKKINAYTMMEVAIAMLLAAICISICYTAYGMIGGYFKVFQQKNAAAEEVLTLRRTMEKDIRKGRYVLRTVDGMDIPGDSLAISYKFADSAILRKVEGLRTDSFHVKPIEKSFFFEGREALEADTVDHVNFRLKMVKQPDITISLEKKYSAQDLFN